MSQQPINPLWSIPDTAGQKSPSTSLRTPRQAIQYKDMFEARRLSASSIGESVCTVHSTWEPSWQHACHARCSYCAQWYGAGAGSSHSFSHSFILCGHTSVAWEGGVFIVVEYKTVHML